MERDVIEQRLTEYLDSYRNDDKQLWLSLFSDNVIFEDPVGKPEIIGLEAMSAFWDKGHNSMMLFQPASTHRIVVCGNEAILVFTMQIRMKDHSGFNIHVINHFVFDENRKIARLRVFWDELAVETVSAN